MTSPLVRTEILARLRDTISSGKPIIGAGAGVGISAKFLEAGEIDMIICYNSGRYRMAGHGSLAGLMPYGDANQIVLDMGREILNALETKKKTPVLAGVCASDPFRSMPQFLRQLREMGYSGVQNFPTVGLIDGTFRANLQETGMGFEREVEMIEIAHAMDLFTTPYVFNKDEAEKMTRAGADVLVAHMGLTTSGSIGAKTGKTLDECVTLIQEIRDAAIHVKPHIIVLCHGGPLAEPKDAEYVLNRTEGIHGFYGASSMERLPVEIAITERTREFKRLKVNQKS